METKFHSLDIDVKTTYLAEDSLPGQAQYVFLYTVTIKMPVPSRRYCCVGIG